MVATLLLVFFAAGASAQLTRCDSGSAWNHACRSSSCSANSFTTTINGISETYYKTTSYIVGCTCGGENIFVYQEWSGSFTYYNSFVYIDCNTGGWGHSYITSGGSSVYTPSSFPAHQTTFPGAATQCPGGTATCSTPSTSPPPPSPSPPSNANTFAWSTSPPPPSPSPPSNANTFASGPPSLSNDQNVCPDPEYPYYCNVGGRCRLPRLKPSLRRSFSIGDSLLAHSCHGTSINLGSDPRAIGCINCNPDECSNCNEGCDSLSSNTVFTCDPAIPTWAYPAGGGVLVVGLIGFLLYRQQRKNQINAFARAQAGATQGNPPVPTAQAVPVQAAQAVAVPAAQPVPAPASHARPIPTLG